ncbi:unnamed protein product [Symbiodinium pilosum]|uniref:peptidylprolyl isomerase n=1 Tax=Symbiodinium pilosum TaxID=2952 RepID=A0A812VW24_SYMPI|nr:unnamed protein product [Symbiodinium pilosum]
MDRRGVLTASLAALSMPQAAFAEDKVPPGSIPTDLVASAVGQKVTTPNGVVYEPLELGTSETGPRNGPPRAGANLLLKYTAHINGFDGPVIDSSALRGSRKPNKVDFIECRLNVDPSLPNCVFEAVKLMKVGAKGRAVCPPSLSYGEGKAAFDADEGADIKKVEAGSTLYYELEVSTAQLINSLQILDLAGVGGSGPAANGSPPMATDDYRMFAGNSLLGLSAAGVPGCGQMRKGFRLFGLLWKTDMQEQAFQLPPEKVVEAVHASMKARKGVVELAGALGAEAELEVSKTGELVYRFPSDVKGALSKVSSAAAAREAWNQAKPAVFTALRAAFGVALFASIAVIYTAIIAISTSSSSDRDRRRGGDSFEGGGGFGFGPTLYYGPSPFDVIFYRPYYSYGMFDADMYERGPTEKPKMGFLESVYSFVFGDGDPNAGRLDRQLAAVAALARRNGGVLTAEQMAPLLDPPTYKSPESTYNVNESWVLPAVSRLNGRPEVAADGQIVYVFDDLQTTAGQSSSRKPPSILEEEEVPFSLADEGNLTLVGLLGVANLLGAAYLGAQFAGLAGYKLVGFLGAVKGAYPGLLAYAVGFFAAPAVRFFGLGKTNGEIQQRNNNRKEWLNVLRKRKANRLKVNLMTSIADCVVEASHCSAGVQAPEYAEVMLKVHSRRTTDVCTLCTFVLPPAQRCGITYCGLVNGDPRRLYHSFDYGGHLCGVDPGYEDKGLLYWPRPEEPEYAVCIAKCPDSELDTVTALQEEAAVRHGASGVETATITSKEVQISTYPSREIGGRVCLPLSLADGLDGGRRPPSTAAGTSSLEWPRPPANAVHPASMEK